MLTVCKVDMFRLSRRSAFSQTIASIRSLLRSVFLGVEAVSKHQFSANCSIPEEDVHGELVGNDNIECDSVGGWGAQTSFGCSIYNQSQGAASDFRFILVHFTFLKGPTYKIQLQN